MDQNRKPPAYLEYAATILAQLPFRRMTLQERGLFCTMRLECWVNKQLPSNHKDLSKILGLSVEEVAGSLAAVMPFFKVVDGFIVCPELEDYRTYLADRKKKQSQGGKRGSAITNSKRSHSNKVANNGAMGTSSSNSQLPRQDSDESLVKSNTDKLNQAQSIKKELVTVNDDFVKEYEDGEKQLEAQAYAKASRGE